MKPYVGRFAPSPTGPLHFGSLIAAVASYLDAHHHGGQWLVRIEDVDTTRCRSEWADDQLRTLTACGLNWDGPVAVQSSRTALYDAALDQLRLAGALYACTCSRREIADSALAGLDGPVYPGTCRLAHRSETDAALRVMTDDQPIHFEDQIQGLITQRLASEVGDFVVRRRDGLIAYQLAVVVDDADQGITHIVRGADLLDSTPRQIHLQRLLGLPACEYSHVPVAVNAAGQKLSKQTLAPSIAGADAMNALRAALQFLGQPEPAGGNIPELLRAASANWNRAGIPRLRHQPVTSTLSG